MPFKDMSIEDYHKHSALGSSDLRLILQNPRVFRAIKDGKIEQKTTAQMELGTLVHEYILEPEKFNNKYLITEATDKRTKEYKKAKEYADENGLVLLLADLYREVQLLANKVLNKELILLDDEDKVIFQARMDKILDKAGKESSWFCMHEGVELKCRPDILVNISKDKNKPYYIVIDLKTTDEPTKDNFIKSGGRYYYHLQDFHYRQVLKANDIEVQHFLFLMIGKKEGTNAEFFKWNYTALELAEELWNKAIQKYKYCRENNLWLESEFDFFANKFTPITTCDLPNYMYYLY